MNRDVLSIIKDFLRGAKNLSKKNRESVYDIVSHAIRRTGTIISQTRKDGIDQPSNILSMTWQDASNKLRKLGNERLKSFANTLEEKGKYWSDPSGYDNTQILEYGMLLTQVEAKLKELTA